MTPVPPSEYDAGRGIDSSADAPPATPTEPRSLSEALRVSQEFQRRLLDASRDCITVLDLDGRLVSMNAGGTDALEIRDPTPYVGRSWLELWTGEDRAQAEAAVRIARQGGLGRFVGCLPTVQRGEPRWWDVAVNAICGANGRPDRLLAVSRDVTELKRAQDALQRANEALTRALRAQEAALSRAMNERDDAQTARRKADRFLRSLVEGTVATTGDDFLHELVRHVATAIGIRYAFVGWFLPPSKIRTLAFWSGVGYRDPQEYDLEGTPCAGVIQGETCHYEQGVQGLFPADRELADLGVVSYLAVPLKRPGGSVLGHLVAMDVKPMPLTDEEIAVFRLFGERAGVELYRQIVERSLKERETTLRAISEGTAAEVGAGFFHSLVKNLSVALGVHYAFVSEFCVDRSKVKTLAFWAGDHFKDNFAYDIAGTPCEKVLAGEIYHCADKVAARFPLHERDLLALGVQSYLAIPVTNAKGLVLGHLAVMDPKPMELEQLDLSVFKIFGARAGAELERTHMEAALSENEQRLRDLFEEAPIAYVHEGLDTRFIRANKAAMNSLGITPDEVEQTYGASFIPDTPDAQRRLKEALASIGRGVDTSGVVLELRRKDNGKPLWIQWWSKPDPSGTYTRTMFLDITEKVLMEQEKAKLEAQNIYLQEEIQSRHNFEEMIGTSAAIRKVFQAIGKVATTDATVLVTGETGTGKELIARAIHNLSPRKGRPLVKVNCAAIPAGLIESELFGHEKGAFTGALARKIGRFELADKGTIFLDEIGELPLDLQAKLLRVLQEGAFERVGGTQTFKVNVRVIAATNRDLEQLVKAGQFRSDMYYRLNVFPIHLPPLREREGDIPMLVTYFVQRYAAQPGKRIEHIPARLLTTLQRYHWPGNVRELEHVIERAVILTDGPELMTVDWLHTPNQVGALDRVASLDEVEREHILSVLERTGWRVSGDRGAAVLLGLKPTTLEARMKKLGIGRSPKSLS